MIINILFFLVIFSSLDAAQQNVRSSAQLSGYELNFASARLQRSKKAIEAVLHTEFKVNTQVPRVGIALSGGGCRAATAALGFLSALPQNICDATSYIAGLSGSTWLLSCLYAHKEFSLKATKERMKKSLGNLTEHMDIQAIYAALSTKYTIYKQPVTLTDVYGCLLASLFLSDLGNEGLDAKLSGIRSKLKDSEYPLPIFTALIDDIDPRRWIEMTPYEVGADCLDTWIQTLDFGRKFVKGKPKDQSPELSLGFLMGMCGSAYALHFNEALRILVDGLLSGTRLNSHDYQDEHLIKFPYKSDDLVDDLTKIKASLSSLSNPTCSASSIFDRAGHVPNFSYGQDPSCLVDEEEMALVDAGIECNIPIIPLLKRNVELIIICDATNGDKSVSVEPLRVAAKKEGYALPQLDIEQGCKQPRLFYDANNPLLPVVVYIPLRVEMNTFKFSYSEEEFDTVFNDMFDITRSAQELIIKGLTIAAKNRATVGGCCIL